MEFIGVAFVTGVLLYVTFAFVYLHFMTVGFAGWESLKDAWGFSVGAGVLLVVCWWQWWEHIGSNVHISFSIRS